LILGMSICLIFLIELPWLLCHRSAVQSLVPFFVSVTALSPLRGFGRFRYCGLLPLWHRSAAMIGAVTGVLLPFCRRSAALGGYGIVGCYRSVAAPRLLGIVCCELLLTQSLISSITHKLI
jgi:hypothetical protein